MIGGKKRTVTTSETTAEGQHWKQDPDNPQALFDAVENKPVVTQVTQRRSVVDSEYMPITRLILHSQGDLWQVDYYRQLVGLDNQLKPLDTNISISEQQYECIKGFEVRVDTPLSATQDTESKEFNVTGGGAITHGIVPNYGDMFIADIGNGKAGLLSITSSEKATYTKDAACIVQWVLLVELPNPQWIDDLNSKVVKTVNYVRELVELYDSPFMSESAYQTYVGLAEQDKRLIEFFKRMFWSSDVHSIQMPEVDNHVYDGWHARFCRDLGLTDINKPIKTYGLGKLGYDDITTIWDLFKDMDTYRLDMLHRDFCINGSKSLPGVHVMRTISWSPFNAVLLPQGTIETSEGSCTFMAGSQEPMAVDMSKGPRSLPEALGVRFNLNGNPLYYPVSFKPYVFSSAFYERRTEDMSILELMAYKAITGDIVPSEVVEVLVKELFTEPKMSIYYYTPIVLVLIHYCKRGV